MSTDGGGENVNMKKQGSTMDITKDAQLLSTNLQYYHLYSLTVKKNGGSNIRQVGFVVPKIDALPERPFSAKIKRILNRAAGGADH